MNEEINHLEKMINETGERQDLTRFQIEEIELAAVSKGEDEMLAHEKRRLQHAEELMQIVSEGYQILYERHDSALSSISQCIKRLDKGAEIDPALSYIKEALAEVEMKLEDASFALRDFQKAVNMDPRRLEEVMERLELLNSLKRKYGQTLEEVLQFKDKLASMIYDLDEKREKLVRLSASREALASEAMDRAVALSGKRKGAARALEKAVEEELHQLHMADTRFQVKFEEASEPRGESNKTMIENLRADGFDRVEFMMCPNVGEELRPLSRIASGGELSRIMLAIKTILAGTASVETIIFDEVDSGISGATAEVVGEKLLSLAEYHQILCITHLPQIAIQGTTHFMVSKEVVDRRTQTIVAELEYEKRIQEIARLLGGREITPSAVAHAREMLEQS